MKSPATSATSSFPPATPWQKTEIQSTSTMAPQTLASVWQPAASVKCSPGSTPTTSKPGSQPTSSPPTPHKQENTYSAQVYLERNLLNTRVLSSARSAADNNKNREALSPSSTATMMESCPLTCFSPSACPSSCAKITAK